MAFALQVEHGVNNMLQDPRPRDVPLLGHMAHQENGDTLSLCNMQQRCRALPDLQPKSPCRAPPAGAELQPTPLATRA